MLGWMEGLAWAGWEVVRVCLSVELVRDVVLLSVLYVLATYALNACRGTASPTRGGSIPRV